MFHILRRASNIGVSSVIMWMIDPSGGRKISRRGSHPQARLSLSGVTLAKVRVLKSCL